LINTGADKRYMKRAAKGEFQKSDDAVLSADRRTTAKALTNSN
jgi:hypothetical protein